MMSLDIVFEVIQKRWKQILTIVLLAAGGTLVVLVLQQPVYKSSAVITAANPLLGDRSNIYRTEFREQYDYYGAEMDNDRLMAIAESEELSRFIVDSFRLVQHYSIKTDADKAFAKAYDQYKGNTRVHKNEFGHIKIDVWDTDKNFAASVATAVVKKVDEKGRALANKMKTDIVAQLRNDYQKQRDSLQAVEKNLRESEDVFLSARRTELVNQLNEKEKLIQQFQTSINHVSVLFVVEEPLPALKKDNPKMIIGFTLAVVLAFVFAVFFLLILDRGANRDKS